MFIVGRVERNRTSILTGRRRMKFPQTRLGDDRPPARGRRESDHARGIGIVDDETTVLVIGCDGAGEVHRLRERVARGRGWGGRHGKGTVVR